MSFSNIAYDVVWSAEALREFGRCVSCAPCCTKEEHLPPCVLMLPVYHVIYDFVWEIECGFLESEQISFRMTRNS